MGIKLIDLLVLIDCADAIRKIGNLGKIGIKFSNEQIEESLNRILTATSTIDIPVSKVPEGKMPDIRYKEGDLEKMEAMK